MAGRVQCFIVGREDGAQEVALADFVRGLGLHPIPSPSLAGLRGHKQFVNASRSLVLLPDTAANPADVGEAAEFVRDAGGQAFVACLADLVAPGDYKRLVRTGSAEWITWGDHRDELRDLVARLNAELAPGRAATTLSFLPSKGGVGNTTLVVEMAAQLASRRKRGARVAILDLNLQGGTVADALDVEPRFDVAEVMNRPERLDEQLIDVFTSRFSKSLDVFVSPNSRVALDAIRPEVIFTIVDLIALRYDALLFDLPSTWSSWTDTLLQGSDAVAVTGGDSVPALRRLAATLDRVDPLVGSDAKVAAVVNAVETDLLGRVRRRTVIDKALAKRRVFPVRRDGAGAAHALDVGRPLLSVAPGGRIARDVKRVADWVEATTERTRAPHPSPAPARKAFA